MTASINLASKHPIIASGVVLLLQTYPLVAAPITKQQPLNGTKDDNSIGLPFKPDGVRHEPCLTDYYKQKENGYVDHFVLNHCDREISGYVNDRCRQEHPYELERIDIPSHGNASLIFYKRHCIKEGVPLVFKRECLEGYKFKNQTAYSVINSCNKKVSGFVAQKCFTTTTPERTFTLEPHANLSIPVLTADCQGAILEGEPLKTYTQKYCASDAPRAERIIGGRPIPTNKTKYLAYVRTNRGNNYSSCSGVFISDRHVLTAAHCFINESTKAPFLEDITVRLGSRNAKPHSIKAAHILEHFVNTLAIGNSDLALLELETPLAEVTPIALASAEDFCSFAKELDKVLKTNRGYPDEELRTYDTVQPVWPRVTPSHRGLVIKETQMVNFLVLMSHKKLRF